MDQSKRNPSDRYKWREGGRGQGGGSDSRCSWSRSVDDFLDGKRCSRTRSRSRDKRRRTSPDSDDSGDYRKFLGERESSRGRKDRDGLPSKRYKRPRDEEEGQYCVRRNEEDQEEEEGRWMSGEEDNLSTSDDHDNYKNYSQKETSEDRYAYLSQLPQRTIVLRGLAHHVTEADIRADILNCSLEFKDIRLIRRKDTGISRGFAFVEFFQVSDATEWIEAKKGRLMITKDQGGASMQYSVPSNFQKKVLAAKDWYCKCEAYNFNRRLTCYRCNLDRNEAGCNEVSPHPTNTVLLRGLDALTTEEGVLKSIKVLSSLPIRSVKIGRDTVTSTSRGLCFIEMNNVGDSVNLYNALKNTEIIVDDKKVGVSYAKLEPLADLQATTKAMKGRMADTALAAAQWSHQKTKDSTPPAGGYTVSDIPRLAEYSASLYATNPQEKAAYLTYYEDYYKKCLAEGGVIPDVSKNVPTVTASPVVKSENTLTEAPDGSGDKTYPVPDVSTYQYDKSSGYYYDPYTTLYYDAGTQYYFNGKLSKFLYWDGTKLTYLPAPTHTQQQDQKSDENGLKSEDTKEEDKKKETVEEKDKIKVAKRIAKDMAKWAKALNQKKETAKLNIVATQEAAVAQMKAQGSADIGYAVLERKELGLSVMYDQKMVNEGLVAAYSDSDEEQEQGFDSERQHVDTVKMVCLLCKRQFPSREVLQKHVQMSDLHKQNLINWTKSNGNFDVGSPLSKIMYRDRAKERRLKFGEPETLVKNHLKEHYNNSQADFYEEPTKNGIQSDNPGSKMLKKMGWHEGTGLGKSNQGRTTIIQAESRSATAGLGSRPAGIYTPGPGETYRDCVKKMARIRYQELN